MASCGICTKKGSSRHRVRLAEDRITDFSLCSYHEKKCQSLSSRMRRRMAWTCMVLSLPSFSGYKSARRTF